MSKKETILVTVGIISFLLWIVTSSMIGSISYLNPFSIVFFGCFVKLGKILFPESLWIYILWLMLVIVVNGFWWKSIGLM